MQSFEKLGAFYLGREYDRDAGAIRDDLLLYDAKDLTTHAVCVGMTGSGKTGLCVSLLEEAAIDGIPAIAIDPKGDLGNLALGFPKLRPSDFRPWIDESEAARKGRTPDEHAASVAALWKKGLGQWGQDGSRIARFRDAVDLAIYTPGSSAGRRLRVLRSFAAPPAALVQDSDAFRERITAAVSGLLALLGLDADPIRSREHILLSNLLQHSWQQGRESDLASLIREIQSPPFERIGVMDLETFFPATDRFGLAMRLNNLLGSPGFAAWMEGEPLDVQKLLWTAEGKPRISILNIAHLSDPERMFFVTLLLNEVVAWMRGQPGTSSLRALLYMDEVFGYFPPTANPPSKTPMLTLLKQARAYGLGVVLATQNPVDLDYKGLSNAGTWFLGRLQTERDKARVLEGLEGASAAAGAGFDRQRMEATLAGLKSRVFLMNNVHDDRPTLFHTRWALSYLRGPLTRSQISQLSGPLPAAEELPPAVARSAAVTPPPVAATPAAAARAVPASRPVLPAGVTELFLSHQGDLPAGERLLYRPALVGNAELHYADARRKVDHWEAATLIAALSGKPAQGVWKGAAFVESGLPHLDTRGRDGAQFADLPAAATRPRSYETWTKKLTSHLYRDRVLQLWRSPDLKETSAPGESEGEFRVRLAQRIRERRDLGRAKLERRYTPKLARLQERIRKAQEKVAREQSQYGQQKLQTAISVGATVLGALFGRKAASVGTVGRATTAARGMSRAAREKQDIARAKRDLKTYRAQLADMEREFQGETARLREALDATTLELQTLRFRPRKSDMAPGRATLVWTPWRVRADGLVEPLARPAELREAFD